MQTFIEVSPPFSLRALIQSHGWIQLAPFQHEDQRDAFQYVARLDAGKVIALSIRASDAGVSIRTSERISEGELADVRKHVAWMLALEQDFSGFYALVRQEAKLAHLEAAARGRVLRCPTIFEDVVKTILTTNTTWQGTIRMVDTLVSLYGDPLPNDPARRAFPTPERLALLDEAELRTTGRLGYRAPYILELARKTASGELDLESLKTSHMPTEALRTFLLSIKGVGAYAAANLLMLLGRYDYIPVDSYALKMVSHEWYGGNPITAVEVEAAFERWGEWKGLAFWFWDWEASG